MYAGKQRLQLVMVQQQQRKKLRRNILLSKQNHRLSFFTGPASGNVHAIRLIGLVIATAVILALCYCKMLTRYVPRMLCPCSVHRTTDRAYFQSHRPTLPVPANHSTKSRAENEYMIKIDITMVIISNALLFRRSSN
jgi:hypothetical protein